MLQANGGLSATSGAVTLGSTTVQGPLTVTGGLTSTAAANTLGATEVTALLTVSGYLQLNNGATSNGGLQVADGSSFNGGLTTSALVVNGPTSIMRTTAGPALTVAASAGELRCLAQQT